jgi:hypothetical protein
VLADAPSRQRSGESSFLFTFFIDNQHCVAIYVVQHHCFAMRGRPRRAQMATKRKTAKKPAKKAAGKVAKRTPKRKTAKRAKKSAKKAPGKAKGKKKPARGARKAARKPPARARRANTAGTPKAEPPKDVPPMLGGVAPSRVGLDDEGEEE